MAGLRRVYLWLPRRALSLGSPRRQLLGGIDHEARSASRLDRGLKSGKGTVSTESGVLSNIPYSYKTRFEGEKGPNSEELTGAVMACSML